MGEVSGDFARAKIHVGKNHVAAFPLFEHLRPPTCFSACIEPLAARESQLLQDANQAGEVPAAGTIGVMIVVLPAQSQGVLAGPLHPGGPVAAGPVFAFGGEEQVRGPARAEVRHRRENHVHRVLETVLCLRECRLRRRNASWWQKTLSNVQRATPALPSR